MGFGYKGTKKPREFGYFFPSFSRDNGNLTFFKMIEVEVLTL